MVIYWSTWTELRHQQLAPLRLGLRLLLDPLLRVLDAVGVRDVQHAGVDECRWRPRQIIIDVLLSLLPVHDCISAR